VIDTHPDILGKNYPRLTSIADNAYLMIIQDMILAESAKNQTRGRKVYGRNDISVPEVWLSIDAEHLFMYQTKAEGKKISKYSLEVQKRVLKRVVEVWLEEALFRTGFFHADLHQGNSMVKPAEGSHKDLKSLIDFGMVGQLTQKDRVNLLGLGIAVKLNDPKVLSEIAWKLSEG
jgi:ubiquinone biosynthesis protein